MTHGAILSQQNKTAREGVWEEELALFLPMDCQHLPINNSQVV